MREILFRGRCVRDSKYAGEWVTGGLAQMSEGITPHDEDLIIRFLGDNCTISYHVEPDTVGQYTGLCDKHGNKIFEGDVVGIAESDTSRYVVKFGDGMFFASFANEYDIWENCPLWVVADKFSVIGNIYDKKEE